MGKKVLIAYATLTGNTQQVAEKMNEYLQTKEGVDETVLEDMNSFTPEQINNFDLCILGSSTWNDGKYNPTSEAFFQSMDEGDFNFSGVKFAIFGLGESFYPEFCTVVDAMRASVTAKGGKVVGESLKIDGMPSEEIFNQARTWLDQVVV